MPCSRRNTCSVHCFSSAGVLQNGQLLQSMLPSIGMGSFSAMASPAHKSQSTGWSAKLRGQHILLAFSIGWFCSNKPAVRLLPVNGFLWHPEGGFPASSASIDKSWGMSEDFPLSAPAQSQRQWPHLISVFPFSLEFSLFLLLTSHYLFTSISCYS